MKSRAVSDSVPVSLHLSEGAHLMLSPASSVESSNSSGVLNLGASQPEVILGETLNLNLFIETSRQRASVPDVRNDESS